jgi:hypothetical protein
MIQVPILTASPPVQISHLARLLVPAEPCYNRLPIGFGLVLTHLPLAFERDDLNFDADDIFHLRLTQRTESRRLMPALRPLSTVAGVRDRPVSGNSFAVAEPRDGAIPKRAAHPSEINAREYFRKLAPLAN